MILKKAKPRGEYVIGLMSGTSADGIDAVLTKISSRGKLEARVIGHAHKSFSGALRRKVLHLSLHGRVEEICELNFVLGELFAEAALGVMRKARLRPKDIHAIGSHGQTLHHLPNAEPPSTLQLGEPAIIAQRTGVVTVADFRTADMAAGGQGAPLAPYADWVLFTEPRHARIIQNIGGIGNLTYLPPGASLEEVRAFDTGPGNMLMDAMVSKITRGKASYDRDGNLAARGKVSEVLLREMMGHPFVRRRPPKTTGREEFGGHFLERITTSAKRQRISAIDVLATLTAFTAESIVDAYERFIFPRMDLNERKNLQVILGGGGAKNRTLRRMLSERLESSRFLRGARPAILTHQDFGIANEAKEGLAFALLAYETLRGKPSNVPGATGARKAVVLGKVVLP